MKEEELLPFSSARCGDRVQLVDPEGGWQWPALLLTDPAPCADLCGGLTAQVELPSGALARQHASAAHLMRVISRAGDLERAREDLAARVEPEREYQREKADDDVTKNHQGDDEQ